jgi:hypothetical protein
VRSGLMSFMIRLHIVTDERMFRRKEMKKFIVLTAIVICVLAFAGCGTDKVADVDLSTAYSELTTVEDMPTMVVVPEDKAEVLLGIDPEECKQLITAICQDSLRADEIWLVQANDESSAKEIMELANNRIAQKSAELENYNPEQYKIVQQAKVYTSGNYVILIVSPLADTLVSMMKDNYGIG